MKSTSYKYWVTPRFAWVAGHETLIVHTIPYPTDLGAADTIPQPKLASNQWSVKISK